MTFVKRRKECLIVAIYVASKHNVLTNLWFNNPFPNEVALWRFCSRRLWKTLWQNETLLISSNLFSCHNVFNSIQYIFFHFYVFSISLPGFYQRLCSFALCGKGLNNFLFEACEQGFNGPNCDGRCSCENNSTCNIYSGQCNCTSPGWHGVSCDKGIYLVIFLCWFLPLWLETRNTNGSISLTLAWNVRAS